MAKAAIIYWSKTGNTKKVAEAIQETLSKANIEVRTATPKEADDIDWYAYDLICLGFPSYHWHPPAPMDDYLERTFVRYRKKGRIKVGSPRIPGKHALVFCTYSGPHTGLDEATPAVDYAGQFFAHLGFAVLGKWCIVGEFRGSLENSTLGRLGDIRGRPDEQDLERVRQDTVEILAQIQAGV
jgi:putative NADPH-quinone reductase